MLSGIKTVKRVTGRKRKEKEPEQSRLPVRDVTTKDEVVTRVSLNRDDQMESTAFDGGTTTSTAAHKSSNRIISKETNVAAAQELRKLLSNSIPIQSKDDDNVCSLVDRHTEQLLQKLVTASASKTGSSIGSSFTLMDDSRSPNNCRYPAMGTTKAAAATDMSSITIDQLRREELTQRQSMDEIYARNISRLGSKYQNTDFTSGSNIPETEYDIGENNSTTLFTYSSSSQKKRRGQTNPAYNDTTNRNYCNIRPNYSSITNANNGNSHNRKWSSTWWFHSSSFRKHLLLAIGDYVSLALASAQDSIVDGHCYLVPNQPTESFLSCNSVDRQQFWEEVDRFQSALRTMYWNSR